MGDLIILGGLVEMALTGNPIPFLVASVMAVVVTPRGVPRQNRREKDD